MILINVNKTSHCPKIQLTFPFEDATKTSTTEISRQGGVGDTLIRSFNKVTMGFRHESHSGSALFYKADEQLTRQEYLHERHNYFSSESMLFCLFKQKEIKLKKKKRHWFG